MASSVRTKLASIFKKPDPKPYVAPSPLSFSSFASFGGGVDGSNSPVIGAPGSAPEPEDNRLVLVFDIDATLVDTDGITTIPTLKATRDYLALPGIMNQRILDDVIVPAAKLRSEGKIAAILVLSNNGMPAYIAGVCDYIAKYVENEIGRQKPGRFRNARRSNNATVERIPEYFFDYVMTRDTDGRVGGGNPLKRLEDVANMLRFLGLSTYDLRSRTFMFDDLRGHQIQSELGSNYILIRSNKGPNDGYKAGSKEISDYSPILERFRMLKGPISGSGSGSGEMPTPTLNNIGKEFGNELAGGRRRRKRSRRMKLKRNIVKKRKTYRRRQRGGGQYCAKKENGKLVDYVYCAAECDSEGVCSPYS